jgi:hypothetical protein
LLEAHLSNSVTDEFAVCYIAEGLQAGEAEPEETEQLSVRRVLLTDAVDMVMRGEITDALSVMALLKASLIYRK